MYKLVLIRHGESEWNLANRFTGWHDVDLTNTGIEQAKLAGQLLRETDFEFDQVFTSVLLRAIRTVNIVLEEMGQLWLPVERSWRLNERHYGALTGLDKAETAMKHGADQVKIWRRSFDMPPPSVDEHSEYFPGKDPRYKGIDWRVLPRSESLALTIDRVLPYWHDVITPNILTGKKVLIGAHGNSLRALVKYLDDMSNTDVLDLNIPTGVPLVYELDKNLRPLSKNYLGDQGDIEAAMKAVANQGNAK
ncbi:MAG: 2,3-diphosphoglycerate-dependent phosphoglycerate mutase [Endozoicomonas sp. (ex Botrylloides leachii)]|nr:2,3-diphosphoglycerate-dependent phosphoglycerate mutase [Endozoicomonas sp. (ex Botrylloides leachii)]